jgi:hypothetical protein
MYNYLRPVVLVIRMKSSSLRLQRSRSGGLLGANVRHDKLASLRRAFGQAPGSDSIVQRVLVKVRPLKSDDSESLKPRKLSSTRRPISATVANRSPPFVPLAQHAVSSTCRRSPFAIQSG